MGSAEYLRVGHGDLSERTGMDCQGLVVFDTEICDLLQLISPRIEARSVHKA